ncbi:OsmC family protein [Carnobacterium divergens]|uniref:OsmC family protein n=1 Tax=Carnobacterium divergens TaxID=2748 RepID=UPI00289040AE|nr:OsmC family protein [Carnobacterium divergens]MDT2010944.1 OsmC family protein [Carnobacterium divergens]
MNQNEKSIYQTTAINETGVAGVAYIEGSEGWKVNVSSPVSKEPGTNPEELLALAYSTCLNATVETILKEQQQPKKSSVKVTIALIPETIGYHFNVTAKVFIESLSQPEIQEIVELANQRCPISKLMKGSQTVTVMATTTP